MFLLAVAGLPVSAASAQEAQRIPSTSSGEQRHQAPGPREVRSENGRFLLRITPARRPGQAGGCRAELLERGRGRRWEARLVNEVAPSRAFVHDEGRFVVTVDEQRRGGARHALVIYGATGELLREFHLTELLGSKDWAQVRVRGRAIEWADRAHGRFLEDPAHFVLRLQWGREVRIDLRTLTVIDAPDDPQDVPDDVAAALAATESPADPQQELVQQLMELIRQRLDRGEPLPVDQEALISELLEQVQAEEGELHEALAQLLEAPSGEPSTQPALAGPGGHGAPQDAAPGVGADGPGQAQTSGSAGNSAAFGLAVPMPDPARPVDYMEWFCQQTQVDGPNAHAEWQAAVEACVAWQGDQELRGAALSGDPEALQSPEIIAWLEANRAALEHMRKASDLPYRGWVPDSDEVSERAALMDIGLPHLWAARELAKVTVVEARRALLEGRPDEALEGYLLVFRIGAQLGRGPTLVENLVGTAVQSLGALSLLEALASPAGAPIDCAELARRLDQHYPSVPGVERALQFERAMVLDQLQRLYEHDAASGQYRPRIEAIRHLLAPSKLDPLDQAGAVAAMGAASFEQSVDEANRVYDRLSKTLGLPGPQARQELEAIEREFEEPGFRARNPALAVLLPSMSRAVLISQRTSAWRNATRLAVHLLAYRQQHGAYPDSLDVFAQRDFAMDPLTGQRYVYRRDGEGFVLYSFGPNGTDEGGVHDGRGETSDIVFWPPPPWP